MVSGTLLVVTVVLNTEEMNCYVAKCCWLYCLLDWTLLSQSYSSLLLAVERVVHFSSWLCKVLNTMVRDSMSQQYLAPQQFLPSTLRTTVTTSNVRATTTTFILWQVRLLSGRLYLYWPVIYFIYLMFSEICINIVPKLLLKYIAFTNFVFSLWLIRMSMVIM